MLVHELHEEIEDTDFVNDLLSATIPLAVYMGSVPREVHGNNKHPASVYVHEMSIFATRASRQLYEDHLKILLKGSDEVIRETLFGALKPIYGESDPGIVTMDEIVAGRTNRFFGGFDEILAHYLKSFYGKKVDVPGFESIETDIVYDLHPHTPFLLRPTSQHNRLNPYLRGDAEDAQVYRPESRK